MQNQNQNETLANIAELLLAHKTIMNIDELSKYSGLSKSAIYKLTSAKKFEFSQPNGKMIWVRREIFDRYLLSNPIASVDDIDAAAIDYVTNKAWKGGYGI